MIKRFKRYGKFKEYLCFEFENIFAYISSFAIIGVSIVADYYSNFNNYIEFINAFICSLIGAYIGSLALIFAGVVFWGSLLNEEFELKLVKYTNDKEVVDKLYTSFLFLAFNILCVILGGTILVILSNSALPKPHIVVFYVIESVFAYWNLFVLAYFVALIRNSVDLIRLQSKKSSVKSIYEKANEIRIDIIFQYLYRNSTDEEKKEELKAIIMHYMEDCGYSKEEKKELMNYYTDYYGF